MNLAFSIYGSREDFERMEKLPLRQVALSMPLLPVGGYR